jgi:hypothetical protein
MDAQFSRDTGRIFHGKITGDPYRPARLLRSHDVNPPVQKGQLVARWNHHFIWDEKCIPGDELQSLRGIGDDVCDEVLTFLGLGRGDMLEKLEGYMTSTPRAEWAACVEKLWSMIETQPPEGVDSSHGLYQPKIDGTSAPCTLVRGQEVFWRYVSPILTSLLHFSLVGTDRFPSRN